MAYSDKYKLNLPTPDDNQRYQISSEVVINTAEDVERLLRQLIAGLGEPQIVVIFRVK
jgi:hypothetical protein